MSHSFFLLTQQEFKCAFRASSAAQDFDGLENERTATFSLNQIDQPAVAFPCSCPLAKTGIQTGNPQNQIQSTFKMADAELAPEELAALEGELDAEIEGEAGDEAVDEVRAVAVATLR